MNKFYQTLRVPDGQKPVKDGLLAATRQRPQHGRGDPQTDRTGYAGRAPPTRDRNCCRRRLPVAHGQVLGDALLGSSQAIACFSVADLVDELQPERLAAREDPPVADGREIRARACSRRSGTTPLNQSKLSLISDRMAASRLRRRRLERARRRLQRCRLQLSMSTPELFEEARRRSATGTARRSNRPARSAGRRCAPCPWPRCSRPRRRGR